MSPTAQQVYAMLGKESLWDVAQLCHVALVQARVPYAIAGCVAVCLRGYQRNTVDLDLLVRCEDMELVKAAMKAVGLEWSADRAEFLSPSGVAVQFLLKGDRAGPGSDVLLPDPSAKRVVDIVEGFPVLLLACMIESKVACEQASVRRSHKGFADVVELIAIDSLSRSFARYLHRSVRDAFRKLVLASRGQ